MSQTSSSWHVGKISHSHGYPLPTCVNHDGVVLGCWTEVGTHTTDCRDYKTLRYTEIDGKCQPENPTSCECSEINSSAMWQGIMPLSDLSTTVELNSHNITCLSCLHYPPTFNFGWKKHSKRTWACSSTTTLGNNNPPLVITTFKESRGKTVHVKAMKFRPST